MTLIMHEELLFIVKGNKFIFSVEVTLKFITCFFLYLL